MGHSVHICCCAGQGDGERQRGTIRTVRRELLDLFLQVVGRWGQWQAEEGVFFFPPANCSGMSLYCPKHVELIV